MQTPSAQHVELLLRWMKDGPPGAIAIERGGQSLGHLRAATWEDAGDAALMGRLASWHCLAPVAARRWLVEEMLEAPDRALFWVTDARGDVVGHVGLSRFDFARATFAVGDRRGDEGLLADAATALARWVGESFVLRPAA